MLFKAKHQTQRSYSNKYTEEIMSFKHMPETILFLPSIPCGFKGIVIWNGYGYGMELLKEWLFGIVYNNKFSIYNFLLTSLFLFLNL